MNGKRLKALREEYGITQKELADRLSLTPKAISFYELDKREPTGEVLIALANMFHTSTDYLLGNKEQKDTQSKGVRIPVLGRVVAGIPIDAIEEVVDWEEIPVEMAKTGEFFGLRITGHSMEPRICDGDVVIVKKQSTVESGEIAIVLVNGNDATIKRVKIQETGITLIATNISVYEPHFYTNEEIKELPVQILGKVVELRGKL